MYDIYCTGCFQSAGQTMACDPTFAAVTLQRTAQCNASQATAMFASQAVNYPICAWARMYQPQQFAVSHGSANTLPHSSANMFQ
jgi:hypothetical protein